MAAAQSVPRVLIVEDDADARDMLPEFLRSEGFEPIHARDGVDAMSVVLPKPLDLADVSRILRSYRERRVDPGSPSA